jgi:hypothetical protein
MVADQHQSRTFTVRSTYAALTPGPRPAIGVLATIFVFLVAVQLLLLTGCAQSQPKSPAERLAIAEKGAENPATSLVAGFDERLTALKPKCTEAPNALATTLIENRAVLRARGLDLSVSQVLDVLEAGALDLEEPVPCDRILKLAIQSL